MNTVRADCEWMKAFLFHLASHISSSSSSLRDFFLSSKYTYNISSLYYKIHCYITVILAVAFYRGLLACWIIPNQVSLTLFFAYTHMGKSQWFTFYYFLYSSLCALLKIVQEIQENVFIHTIINNWLMNLFAWAHALSKSSANSLSHLFTNFVIFFLKLLWIRTFF